MMVLPCLLYGQGLLVTYSEDLVLTAWDVKSHDRLWIRQFSCALVSMRLIDRTELWLSFTDTSLLVLDAFTGAWALLGPFRTLPACAYAFIRSNAAVSVLWLSAASKQTTVVPKVQYSLVDVNINGFVSAIYPSNVIQLSVWDDMEVEAPIVCWESDLDRSHRVATLCVLLSHKRVYTCSADR